jgi:hypothetical protein
MSQTATTVHGRRSIQVRANSHLILLLLGGAVYKDVLACAWEPIKNGAWACQKSRDTWDPKLVYVDIRFPKKLALALEKTNGVIGAACVILDHGSGLTDEHLERFSDIGPGKEFLEKKGVGVSQKRIGRFAIDALCSPDGYFGRDPTYFLVTRTRKNGPIEIACVRRSDLILDDGKGSRIDFEPIDPSHPSLVGIRPADGRTFTATVVPDPTPELTPEKLYEALSEQYLPRGERYRMDVRIDGKPVETPALPKDSRTSEDGKYVAYLRYVRHETRQSGGRVLLCDGTTGMPIAPLSRLGDFGHDLGSSCIEGVVFVDPDVKLLAHQDTSRSRLSAEFTASKTWTGVKSAIKYHFDGFAGDLAHQHGRLGTSKSAVVMDRVKTLFADVWGEPDVGGTYAGPGGKPEEKPGGGKGGGKGGKGGKPSGKPGGKPPAGGQPPAPPPPGGGPGPTTPTARRERVFYKIDGINWEARRSSSLARSTFAEATLSDDGQEAILDLNLDDYAGAPSSITDYAEHFSTEVIGAVARAMIERGYRKFTSDDLPGPQTVLNDLEALRSRLLVELRQNSLTSLPPLGRPKPRDCGVFLT